ncbi:MAG: 30S ribosomal protein S20 [Bullifex sp.]|nr:30S ribosomal protein S20 [Spirochaetales bacterium]MDY2816832.1 30S ribosomal protein S20 [Bullifex sp.]MDD7009069.1 30S ribosomal protein S20 [Spirochaetales bacterium]MDD7535840.1 30S ribosomal protein S20 [Spirochaetales bacterium]MDY3851182.1 30S ribosomal protein S20 [Bullifex sp.]
MANRSAEKRERQNVKRRMHNRMIKSSVRTQIKKFDAAVVAGDKEAAKDAMALSFKLLDSAASKGVLHRNTASRKKSRIYKAFAKLA